MKIVNYLNAGMWLANAVVWGAYAHVPFMVFFSMCGVLAAVMLARLSD